MHEIITLQLGNFSNYTATHFWNVQESYFTYGSLEESQIDHNVHWRAGIGTDGSETFLPRTVIYDLKGGFGALRKVNPLYDPVATETSDVNNSLWLVTTLRGPGQQHGPGQCCPQSSRIPRSALEPSSQCVRTGSVSRLFTNETRSSKTPFSKVLTPARNHRR